MVYEHIVFVFDSLRCKEMQQAWGGDTGKARKPLKVALVSQLIPKITDS